ncbi:MAG: endo alpha-1,4 polygalactosaminidase [Exilispira sp.]
MKIKNIKFLLHLTIFFLLTYLLFFPLESCLFDPNDYKQLMRDFVKNISIYAKSIIPNFIIIPQNGVEIIDELYLLYIDGIGQEDFFYGFYADDIATPQDERDYLLNFINIAKDEGKTILIIDYCKTKDYIDDSYQKNNELGFISFAADHRQLDNIPSYPVSPYNENNNNINSLSDAKNFLYIINPSSYNSKQEFIKALKETNYDIIIIDLFFYDQIFTKDEVESLKIKKNGAARLIICYMSIGEAEDYRYYWQDSWYIDPPSFLAAENPNWQGNYKVKYWDPVWQAIIYGNDQSYLKKIIDAGFDGVYLDIIDAYEYFEK